MAANAGARCERAKAVSAWQESARRELAKHRMRVTEVELTALLADYGRLSARISSAGDRVDGDWPARVAILAEVVLDARCRVEMVELDARMSARQ